MTYFTPEQGGNRHVGIQRLFWTRIYVYGCSAITGLTLGINIRNLAQGCLKDWSSSCYVSFWILFMILLRIDENHVEVHSFWHNHGNFRAILIHQVNVVTWINYSTILEPEIHYTYTAWEPVIFIWLPCPWCLPWVTVRPGLTWMQALVNIMSNK